MHIDLFKKIRLTFVAMKIYTTRVTGYISLINLYILIYLTLSDIKKYGIFISLKNWIIPILIVLTTLMIFIGYLDDKFGFLKEEISFTQRRNKQMIEINEKLDKVLARLKNDNM